MLIQFPTADSLIYPIVDGDNASALVTKEDGFEFVGVEGDYGNLYWSNEDASTVVSWRGSPHRYYRVPDKVNIPSLSRYFSGRPLMTTFSNLVYQGGVVIASTPFASPVASYIMGASYPSKLIVIALQDTESSFDTVVWVTDTPDPDTEKCAWAELGRWNTGRTELPWFSDATGLNFRSVTGARITIDKEVKTATYQSLPDNQRLASFSADTSGGVRRFPTGLDVYILRYNGSDLRLAGQYYWESIKFTQSFNAEVFYDQESACTLTLTSTSESPTIDQGSVLEYTGITAKLLSPGELTIAGPDYWTGANYADFTIVHNVGNVTWQYPDGTCGGKVINAQDACGRSASKNVQGTGGRWVSADPDHGVNPVGWSIGEWHYTTPTSRTRLVAHSINARVAYIDGLARCPHTNLGWDGATYYEATGSPGTVYGACTGAPGTSIWWNGACNNTWFYEQQCPGNVPCSTPFAYLYVAGNVFQCPPVGDSLITLAEQYYRAWSKYSRQQSADGYTIETEVWVCP